MKNTHNENEFDSMKTVVPTEDGGLREKGADDFNFDDMLTDEAQYSGSEEDVEFEDLIDE